MWFKNLAVYRFIEPFTLNASDLEEKLQKHPFTPCGSQDEFSFGWTSPIGRASDLLVNADSSNRYLMICAKKQEKLLPAQVISELLQEKINEIEDREARRLPAKERSRIRDELIFELLPRAFSFSRKTHAYIDSQNGWIVVDAASTKKAEDLLYFLRKSLGSLPVVPIGAGIKPAMVMTNWLLTNSAPENILIESECELRSPEQEGAIIRCKRHDLTLPEIKNHLDSGKQVINLAMTWADRISFVLDENLQIKRLKFLDLIQEQSAEVEAFDEVELFKTDLLIMADELSKLFVLLQVWFVQLDEAKE